MPCWYMSGIRNQEDAGTVTLPGVCCIVSDVFITGGSVLLVPRLPKRHATALASRKGNTLVGDFIHILVNICNGVHDREFLAVLRT